MQNTPLKNVRKVVDKLYSARIAVELLDVMGGKKVVNLSKVEWDFWEGVHEDITKVLSHIYGRYKIPL